MNLKEIVKKYLKENGYDGLFTNLCECLLDDLMTCKCYNNCEAGYIHHCNECDKIAACDIFDEFDSSSYYCIVDNKQKQYKKRFTK